MFKPVITARISHEDYASLAKKSQDFNLSRTVLIREAIKEYLEKIDTNKPLAV